MVEDNLLAGQATEVRWREDILLANSKVEMLLARAAGRSIDEDPQLASDLVDGRLC